jgi:hypothetical protein
MKTLILILTLTITHTFAEIVVPAFDFSSPQGQKYLETVKKADEWAIEYFKELLNSLARLEISEPNAMSVMLVGGRETARENLAKVAEHLSPDDPDSFVEEANFFCQVSSKKSSRNLFCLSKFEASFQES